MARAERSDAQDTEIEDAEGAPPKKSRKKLIFFILALLVLAGGGAAAFMLLNPSPAKHGSAAKSARSEAPPSFFDLGQFTANLVRENEDRYLQVSITLKITDPELEEKIKASRPEILHRINMLLQSKMPSELATYEGKEILARQIREQVEYVVGLRKSAPPINVLPTATSSRTGINEVLFTAFIIQ